MSHSNGWTNKILPTVAAAAAVTPMNASAQPPGTSITSELANPQYNMTYSPSGTGKDTKPFDPEFLKGKPYILVTGRNQCPYCAKVGTNLAAIRKKIGPDIPVVVVDILPQDDKPKIAEYYVLYRRNSMNPSAGAIFTQSGTQKNGFNDANGFIVFPKSWQEAQAFQRNIKTNFNAADPTHQSHELYITVVGPDGKCAGSAYGATLAPDGTANMRIVDQVVQLVGANKAKGGRG